MAGLTLIPVACILLAISGCYGNPRVRAIGGYPLGETPFPHQASVRIFGRHICSGSIIDNKHILTAAHCVVSSFGDVADDVTVVTGTNNLVPGQGNVYQVEQVFGHENYKFKESTNSNDDIAVLRLSGEITFDDRQSPVELPKSPETSQRATVSGWAYFDYPIVLGIRVQRTSDITPLEANECQENYENFFPDTELCANYEQQVDHCTNDSGSALVDDGVLIGFTTRLVPCDNTKPGVFVKVFPYVDWIQSKLQKP